MNQEHLTIKVRKQDPKERSCKVKKGSKKQKFERENKREKNIQGSCSFEIVDRRILNDIKITIPQVLEYIKYASTFFGNE